MKNKFLLFGILALLLFPACKQKHYYKIAGETQGTTYHIIYNYDKMLKPQIDSILREIDNSLSIFNPNSIVSKVNRNEPVKLDKHFINVFNKAMEISEVTNGAFDITVGPLVEAYGFGAGKKLNHLSKKQIDSMLKFVGYKKVKIVGDRLVKLDPRIELDFNAIAQGYTVDVISEYFDRLGIKDYLIEVGGEVLARGKNELGGPWRIGIDKPIENSTEATREVQLIIGLKGRKKAVATSGNYRRFYIENGVKFTHTIDPHTGMPVRDSLLSATILTDVCTTADGYATACMVVGLKRAIELVENDPKLEAFFIYFDKQGRYKFYMTEGFKKYVLEE
jgi:thiamine biosynthesis lipoprotein